MAHIDFRDSVTPLILTLNEEPNLDRTLSALVGFRQVVVLDSGSSDRSKEIALSFGNVRWFERPFDQHATQWNFGLGSCGIDTPWVLALDADYVLSPELADEIAGLTPADRTAGYRAVFRYCVFGRRLRGSLYPPSIVLFRRECGKYVQSGHTQRLVLEGEIEPLRGRIDHDDRKSMARWLMSQRAYAVLEAEHLLSREGAELRLADRIRRTGVFAPPLIFLYTLIVKGCLLDGWPGWIYVLQRTAAEIMIALALLERRMASPSRHGRNS